MVITETGSDEDQEDFSFDQQPYYCVFYALCSDETELVRVYKWYYFAYEALLRLNLIISIPFYKYIFLI